MWGAYALVAATVAGALLEAGLLGWQLRKSGTDLWPQWRGVTQATREVLGQYWPMIVAAFLFGSIHLVTQAMAAMLDPGSVSALSYGNKVTATILGIGATAVSTAFLPHFSELVALRNWVGLRHTLSMYTRLFAVGTIPLTIVLMVLSEPIVALLFQRGAFSESDTRLVAQVQVMYLLQIPAYVIGMLFVRMVSALKANQLMMWCNVLNLFLCVSMTYVFIQWWGVAGIALATSLIYFVNTGLLAYLVLRMLKQQEIEAGLQPIPA
jgi:putative peptidoglycan lipid II flippase